MTTTCETYRDRLLDHAYGLLDEADAWPMATHLRDCAECRAAQAKSVGLIASASKTAHPDVTFTPPAPESAAEPRARRPRTVREAGLRWAVAASLLLTGAALGGPGLRDLAATAWFRVAVDDSFVKLDAAERESNRVAREVSAARAGLAAAASTARAAHDRAAEEWMAAEGRAAKARAASPFTLEIDGPATAIVGAPNEYRVRVAGPNARPVTLVATVAGPDGQPLFTQRDEALGANGATVTLPANLWARLPIGTTPTLTVSATDANRDGGAEAATVTETVRLGEPRAATMLATDKPLYRPGERVYYRSVTLDRASFRPLDREMNLRFVIEGPDGQPVPGSAVVGLARPVHAGPPLAPVVGPDGLPVRGVGTGAFELPTALPGGEYALKVFEVGLVTLTPAEGAKPLAVRKFLVNRYTPDKFLKTLELDGRTYGPGDAVRAKVTVRNQSRPQAAKLEVVVLATVNEAAGVKLPLDVGPTATDAAGDAALKFTLPRGEIADVTVSVTVRANGVVETISKPVPLATRRLSVEFFPEGGDLIAGVPNRVYFRATTAAGRPADLTGTLSDGTAVKTLTDADRPGVNQGMGVFTVTPVAGRADFLTLATPTGIVPPTPKGFPLPTAKATGVVLNIPDGVTNPGEPLRVTLTGVGPAKRSLFVGAYTRGRAVAHARVTLQPGKPTDVALDFGTAKFGGVTRVTVFDAPDADADRAELTPVAERLVFRTPGELLKVTAATQSAGASFLPGAAVELTVTTADESGAPKPAILWAAVVNRSVLTMADDRSARLLPTHFLLAGEVQKPDDLEQADFLLTDHPKAAAALDLVLGTQGWRRFAEQAPGAFQARVASEDGDRLLVAMGGNRRAVAGASVASIRLAETHLPRYEAATAALVQAERERRDEAPIAALLEESNRSQSAANGETARFLDDAKDYASYQDAMDDRRARLPFTAALLFGLATLLAAASRLTRGRWGVAERRWLRRGAVGFALLGAFAVAVTALTFRGYGPWRIAATQKANGRNPVVTPFLVPDEPVLNDGNPPAPPQWVPKKGMVPRAVNNGVAPGGRGTVTLRDGVRVGPADPALAVGTATPKAVTPEMIALANRTSGLRLRFDRVRVTGDIDAESRRRVRDALPPEPTLAVREYANARYKSDSREFDLHALAAETVLWQPVLVTNASGRATVKFDLPDGVGGYQVLVAGHSLDGRLGASVTAIEARAPFAIDVKLPAEIGSADRLTVPVILTNATDREARAALVDVAKNLTVTGERGAITVPANSGVRALMTLTPTVADGVAELSLDATLTGSNAAASSTGRRTVAVVPDGFPVEGSASGLLAKSVTLPLTLPKAALPGTLRASVVVYPNALAEVRGGLDGLLREPNGCFEQASSANYPNVLVLDLLRETGQASPDVSSRAKGLLERGYARLVGFECPQTGGDKRGFEWFGAADRPHLALTSYGLVQFADMARVYPVDAKLLARTKQFLLDARDGRGGYRPPADASHSFGRAPPATVAAYVTWAITQAEAKSGDAPSDLAKELDALFAQATKPGSPEADDPFFLSLTASALLSRKRDANGVKLLEAVVKLQRGSGEVGGVPTSLTASSGKSLAVEATAAAALGWFQADRPDLFAAPLAKAMAWLNAQRDPSGAFGATHSTVLALKAITEQARRQPRAGGSGEFVVRVGGVEVGRKAFTSADAGPVSVGVPESALAAGATAVTVEATGGTGTPVALTWQARTATPENAADSPVTVTTTLDRADYSEGDTARVTVVVANVSGKPVGMVMAVVGLPSGLRLPPDLKQLKALTERPATGEPRVSHFEVRPREVVLYRHGLAAGQSVTVVFDAIAETPGTSRGPASRAYPYYAPEFKHWAKPLGVSIAAK